MFEDSTQLPEHLAYRDVVEIQKVKQLSKRIECIQLFDVLDDKVAPHSILIRGIPGVGKTTFVKQMAKQWAENEIWKQVRYIFVISLRELLHNRMMTLEDFLFDRLMGLSLTGEERRICMEQVHAIQSQVVVFLEGADELRTFKYTDQYERRYGQTADIDTLISSLISGALIPGAKIFITTRPIDQLTSNNRTVWLLGREYQKVRCQILWRRLGFRELHPDVT